MKSAAAAGRGGVGDDDDDDGSYVITGESRYGRTGWPPLPH